MTRGHHTKLWLAKRNNPSNLIPLFMKSHPRILAAIATGLFVAHLPLSGADTPAASNASKKITYAADTKPIIDAACAKCHNAEKPKAGLRMDSLEGVLKGSKKRKMVDPGKSANSRLIKIVESIAASANDPAGKTTALHKKGPKPLSPEQITLLKSWIDQGAK
jgi:cytochrome c553